jgi:putative transposase
VGWLKKEFSRRWLAEGGQQEDVSLGRQRERRSGIWQPRFWEHTIVDEEDFERHFDYIHYNPVKHRYVRCPRDWSSSSIHRWIKQGVYSEHWACWQQGVGLDFSDISNTVGEVVESSDAVERGSSGTA